MFCVVVWACDMRHIPSLISPPHTHHIHIPVLFSYWFLLCTIKTDDSCFFILFVRGCCVLFDGGMYRTPFAADNKPISHHFIEMPICRGSTVSFVPYDNNRFQQQQNGTRTKMNYMRFITEIVISLSLSLFSASLYLFPLYEYMSDGMEALYSCPCPRTMNKHKMR